MYELDLYKQKYGDIDSSTMIGSEPFKGLNSNKQSSLPSTFPASPTQHRKVTGNYGRIFEPTALPDQLAETMEEAAG